MTDPADAQDFLFQNASDAVLIYGADGRIEAVNPAGEALIGEAAAALVGHAVGRLFLGVAALDQVLTEATDQLESLPLVNGRIVLVKAAALETGSRILLMRETAADALTTQRERFVRAAAHDLRNPIAALIGYSALLGDAGGMSEEERLFVNRLQETSNKLHLAASKLMETAWIEAEMPIRRLPCDLSAVAASAVEAAAPLAKERNQKLSYERPAQPLPVRGDEERLGAAVGELLHNAITYSGDGDSTQVRAWQAGEIVYLSVTDEGIGISPSEQETVFDRLYRSRDQRVKAIAGGGVGLTLARRIARYHGGDITLASTLNEGSSFTLRLPALE